MSILTCDTVVAVLGSIVRVECLLSSTLIHFTDSLVDGHRSNQFVSHIAATI